MQKKASESVQYERLQKFLKIDGYRIFLYKWSKSRKNVFFSLFFGFLGGASWSSRLAMFKWIVRLGVSYLLTPRTWKLVRAASRYGVESLENLGYFSHFFPVFVVIPRITRKLVCVCILKVYIFWMLYLLATNWAINNVLKLHESRAWLSRMGVGREFSFIKWKIRRFLRFSGVFEWVMCEQSFHT